MFICPYQYLLDPFVHETVLGGLDLHESVVIFDEAHNISDAAREAYSFEITSREMTKCVNEATNSMRLLSNGLIQPFGAAIDFSVVELLKNQIETTRDEFDKLSLWSGNIDCFHRLFDNHFYSKLLSFDLFEQVTQAICKNMRGTQKLEHLRELCQALRSLTVF